MLVIGLMSGTSADGVDAALVEWPGDSATTPFRLMSFVEQDFPRDLQQRIHRLAAGEVRGPEVLHELLALDFVLGERFASAAEAAAREAGLRARDVDAIASHGQTVAHQPDVPGSLQIGSPSLIAERTGARVVADFRPRDMAIGGQGAPLAPFFHHAVLGSEDEDRVVLNLGGIANLTWLPRGGGPECVVAFDVGPANSLVDGVVQILTDGAEQMDRDSTRALRGEVDPDLLSRLMADEYLERLPPKSTGRERYGQQEARALVTEWRAAGGAEDDLVATLVAFTTEAVGAACTTLLPQIDRAAESFQRLLVGGGGARSPAMMDGLRRALPDVCVEPFDVAGVPLQAAEAMAFSLMGRNALLGLPNHLPRCTGASRAAVLGQLVPGIDGKV